MGNLQIGEFASRKIYESHVSEGLCTFISNAALKMGAIASKLLRDCKQTFAQLQANFWAIASKLLRNCKQTFVRTRPYIYKISMENGKNWS